MDINELLRMEEALRDTSSKLQLLVQSSPLAIITIDNARNVLSWNPAAQRIFGWSEEEILGHPMPTVPETYRDEFRSRHRTVLKGETFTNIERKALTKDGSIIEISLSVAAIKDAEGNINNAMSVISDITEHKRVQAKLRESEARFKAALENTPIVVFNHDKALQYTWIHNSDLCFERPAEEIIGKTDEDLIAPEEASQLMDVKRQVLKSGISTRKEVRITFGKQASFFDLAIEPLKDDSGEIIGLTGIALDISNRIRTEETLRKYSEQLEELVQERTRQLRDKERLAAVGETAVMIGHDLRNPLQAVVTTIYLAKAKLENLSLTEWMNLKELGLMDDLATIEKQSEYMNKIVSDLQDYARPLSPDYRELNLLSFINDVLAGVRMPLNIEVQRNIEEQMTWTVDPFLMDRVLGNLLTNAVQAMPQGGRLIINATKTDDDIVLTIADTGVGISPEMILKIFQPLVTTKAKGMGMGLAVCKRLLDAQGAEIKIESRPDSGTIVIITMKSK